MTPSSKWLGYHPFKVKITGSNPVGVANFGCYRKSSTNLWYDISDKSYGKMVTCGTPNLICTDNVLS